MRVLVAHEAVTAVRCGSRLHVEEVPQVLEDLHLVAVVFTVILDVPLGFPEVAHHRLLLLLLDLEVLVEGLDVRHESLVGVRDVLGLALDALLEGLEDVGLHVVRVELGLALLVFLELGAHVLSDLFFLKLHLLDMSVVILLLDVVFFLNIGHSLANISEFLDSWRELSLLFFDVLLDLLDERGKFLEGLALVIVKLFFQFGDTLDLVFDGGVSGDALLHFKFTKELVDVTRATLQDVLSALKNLSLSFEFF